MNEHNLRDRYGYLNSMLLTQVEQRWGVRFSRRYLVTKQSMRSESHFARVINGILGKLLLGQGDLLLKLYAALCLKQACLGQNAFSNMILIGDTLAVGNNTFCQDVFGIRRLVTFGQTGCVVMFVSSGSRQAIMHYSTHPYYHDMMVKELTGWLMCEAGLNKIAEFRIISHQVNIYIEMINSIIPNASIEVHEKQKTLDYHVLFDHGRDCFLLAPSDDECSLMIKDKVAFVIANQPN